MVNSAKRGGVPPSFFVCVKMCHTLVPLSLIILHNLPLFVNEWLVIVIKKQGGNPAFSYCVQHIERINFLCHLLYYMII